MDMLF